MTKRTFLLAALGLALPAALLPLGQSWGWWGPVDSASLLSRWLLLLALLGYTWKRGGLTAWIFFAMAAGVIAGYDLNGYLTEAPAETRDNVLGWLKLPGDVFIRLVKTIIAPLVFATLVVGIAGHSNLGQVGRIGAKSLGYFIVVTLVALVVGLVAINISQAGLGVPQPEGTTVDVGSVAKPKTTKEVLLDAVPINIARSIFEGNVLQVVVFSILFGIALAMVPWEKRQPILGWTESLVDVMFKFTDLVMYVAPLAAGASIAYAIAGSGLGVLVSLAKLLGTLYVALIAFVLLVLLPILVVMRIPLRPFLKAVREPVTIAFATANSESALPRAMESLERMGGPRKVVSFVLPLGYSFNLDGTTLYLSLATLFVAQAGGLHLNIGEQITILLTLLLTSKGIAGVARASLVVLTSTVATFNLPAWPIGLILGIDVLMDMARTSVNVLGNCLASAVIARWEGEFDDAKAQAFLHEELPAGAAEGSKASSEAF